LTKAKPENENGTIDSAGTCRNNNQQINGHQLKALTTTTTIRSINNQDGVDVAIRNHKQHVAVRTSLRHVSDR
jgi:hypothetical protein